MVGLGGHHVPTFARERIARLSSGPAASITGTLTHPTITNETSPHFAEALASEGDPPSEGCVFDMDTASSIQGPLVDFVVCGIGAFLWEVPSA
jgi:hypothetical protein